MTDFVFSTPGNVSTIGQMARYVNSLTDVGSGGMLAVIFMIVFASGLFMMIRGTAGPKRAFGVAAILNAIVAVICRIGQYVNDQVLTVSVIVAAVGLWMIFSESSRYE